MNNREKALNILKKSFKNVHFIDSRDTNISIKEWKRLGRPLLLLEEDVSQILPEKYKVFIDYAYGYNIVINLESEACFSSKKYAFKFDDYLLVPECYDGEFKIAKIIYRQERNSE